MADIFIDGLDKYGPAGITGTQLQTAVQGDWTTVSAGLSVVAALNSTPNSATTPSYAIGGINNSQHLNKTLPTNYARLIGGFRVSPTNLGSSGAAGVELLDATNIQVSVGVNGLTGTISIFTGSLAGTALATSSASIVLNSIHYIEYDITIGSSASYQVWLDGVSLLSGTGNTRGGSTNNFANVLQFISLTAANPTLAIDDIYLFDNTGATNNAVLLTNPVVATTIPTGDTQTQFTFVAGILGQAYSALGSTNAPGANELFLRKFTPAVACTINSVSAIPAATSGAVNFKAVIYSDNSGSPTGGTLLSSGTQITGTTSGTAIIGPLVTPQSLSAGTPYWIGFITDTSVLLQEVDSTGTGVKAANTYASGAPGTGPAVTTGQPSWVIWGNVTGVASNDWFAMQNNPPAGALSYVQSSTVGNQDLQTYAALPITPIAIYTVCQKVFCARSDSGARTVSIEVNSSGSTSFGSNTGITPGTSFGWVGSFFDTDPHTSAAWTNTPLNSATAGPEVAS